MIHCSLASSKAPKRPCFSLLALVGLLLLAACGSNTSTPTSSGGRYGNGYGNGGTTPTVSSSGPLIQTACSGGCASAWPPLLVSGSNTPTSTTSLPGKLSVQADANGTQVEYNGHPLYTFSGDTAPGQTTGEGFGGIWHVVTPSLT